MESESNKNKAKEIQPVFDVKVEEETSLTLILVDFNENYIRLDVKQDITIQMLRVMIQDISYLSFITNYELKLVRTNEILDYHKGLIDYHIVDFDKIKLVTCLYTKSSVEHHLDRLNYIIKESPPFINEYVNPLMVTTPYSKTSPEYYRDADVLVEKTKEYRNNAKKENMEQLEKIIKSQSQFEENKETRVSTQEKTQPQTQAKDDRTVKKEDNKRNIKLNPKHLSENKTTKQQIQTKEEEFLQNQADTNKQLELAMKSFAETRKKIVDLDFNNYPLTRHPDSLLYEEQPKPQKFKCLNSVSASIHENREKQNGDIKYITIVILEGRELEVTCNERGFFINSSNSTSFNPSPSESSFFSYTLPGLLCQVSTMFKENFTKLLSQVLSVDPLLFQPSPQMKFDWLKPQDNLFYCNYRGNLTLHRDSLVFSKKGQREWNEEFQIIFDKKMVDIADQADNFYKDKYTDVVYNDFRDAAIEGVKLISEKQLLPINYTSMDNISKGLYIYDNIFLSILEDSNNFQTYNNNANAQTYTGGNLDFRHLNYLLRNKYEQELNFLFVMSCIVQYKGTRVYAQSIIPGIIYECENMVEYGAMDEGEIKFNENFHTEMKTFANKFRIKENKVVDKEGKEFVMYGNPELKGINNKDKRRYLFDLVHFMPRDLNFPNKENNGCLLRPEVVYSYEMKLISNKIKENHPEEYKKITGELNYLRKKIRDYKSFGKEYVEKLKANSPVFAKYFEESEKEFRFNTTLYTNSKLSEKEDYSTDDKLLKDLAVYLKEEILSEYLQDIVDSVDDCPYDSNSLTESVHRYGINLRYYGELINTIDKSYPKALSWLKNLIIRDILVRSASHYFNSLLKDLPEYLVKIFTAHFLNLFLSHPNKIKFLENTDISYSNGKYKFGFNKSNNIKEEVKSETKSSKQQKDKKKKKKGKKKKVGSEKESEVKNILSDFLTNTQLNKLIENTPFEESIFIKPSEFWKKIREIALNKFNYDIQIKPGFDYVYSSLNKVGVLRDFCLKIGLQISCQDYDLENDVIVSRNDFKYEDHLPFQQSSICKFCTVVKELSLPSEYLLNIFNKAEEKYLKLEFEESVTMFNQIILVFPEFFGHINKYLAHAYYRLSSIYYLFGDFFIAISYGIKAIITREKLFEYDSKFVADCYSDIAIYYHYFSQDLMGFKCLNKALEIINFVYPKYHPDKARKLEVLAIQYTEIELLDYAEETFLSALNNYLVFYEEDNFKLVQVYFLLSKIYQKSLNLSKSIYYFEKYMNCIIKREVNNPKKKGEEMKKMRDDLKKIINIIKNPEETIKLYSELSNKFMKDFVYDEINNPETFSKDLRFKTNRIERIFTKY